MPAKYIVGPLKSSAFGTVGAVVFPEMCDHAEMAKLNMVEGEVLSAGFCHVFPDGVELFGESLSLKIKSNPEHEGIVRRALGMT